MIKNEQLILGVFYRSSSSGPAELDSSFTSHLAAERRSAELFAELSECLTWPGFQVWVEPINEEGTPTWCFDNTTLQLN